MAFTRARHIRLHTIALLIAILITASVVQAGPLATTPFALNDTFGPDAGRWRGTASVSAIIPFNGDTIVADVDWAAFGPGKFQLYLNSQSIAQVDPSGPGEVIYVYQISSVTAADPGIDGLTVGLDDNDGRGIILAPSHLPTGAPLEKIPNGGGDQTDSMAWFFAGSQLQAGDSSSLLIFTSPFAPELDFMTVNSGLAAQLPPPYVASPSDRLFEFDVPEPSSLVMGLMGCLGLLARNRKA
jgi:hypothetical protein